MSKVVGKVKFIINEYTDTLVLSDSSDDSIGYYRGEKFTLRNGNFVSYLITEEGKKLYETELFGKTKIVYLPDDRSKFLFALSSSTPSKLKFLCYQPLDYIVNFTNSILLGGAEESVADSSSSSSSVSSISTTSSSSSISTVVEPVPVPPAVITHTADLTASSTDSSSSSSSVSSTSTTSSSSSISTVVEPVPVLPAVITHTADLTAFSTDSSSSSSSVSSTSTTSSSSSISTVVEPVPLLSAVITHTADLTTSSTDISSTHNAYDIPISGETFESCTLL